MTQDGLEPVRTWERGADYSALTWKNVHNIPVTNQSSQQNAHININLFINIYKGPWVCQVPRKSLVSKKRSIPWIQELVSFARRQTRYMTSSYSGWDSKGTHVLNTETVHRCVCVIYPASKRTHAPSSMDNQLLVRGRRLRANTLWGTEVHLSSAKRLWGEF